MYTLHVIKVTKVSCLCRFALWGAGIVCQVVAKGVMRLSLTIYVSKCYEE
jgi:hypothetical protein